eukprot:m.91271 g.91271  ORF g.91271 m.91271 type:complete len:795 (-) comp13299_c0_seq3:27-2411(-)
MSEEDTLPRTPPHSGSPKDSAGSEVPLAAVDDGDRRSTYSDVSDASVVQRSESYFETVGGCGTSTANTHASMGNDERRPSEGGRGVMHARPVVDLMAFQKCSQAQRANMFHVVFDGCSRQDLLMVSLLAEGKLAKMAPSGDGRQKALANNPSWINVLSDEYGKIQAVHMLQDYIPQIRRDNTDSATAVVNLLQSAQWHVPAESEMEENAPVMNNGVRVDICQKCRTAFSLALVHPALTESQVNLLKDTFGSFYELGKKRPLSLLKEDENEAQALEAPKLYIVSAIPRGLVKDTSKKDYAFDIEITWNNGEISHITKSYPEFFNFQCGLLDKFPAESEKSQNRVIPYLPGKSYATNLTKSKAEIAKRRMNGITTYLKELTQCPPNISKCRYVVEFFYPDHSLRPNSWHGGADPVGDPTILRDDTKKTEHRRGSVGTAVKGPLLSMVKQQTAAAKSATGSPSPPLSPSPNPINQSDNDKPNGTTPYTTSPPTVGQPQMYTPDTEYNGSETAYWGGSEAQQFYGQQQAAMMTPYMYPAPAPMVVYDPHWQMPDQYGMQPMVPMVMSYPQLAPMYGGTSWPPDMNKYYYPGSTTPPTPRSKKGNRNQNKKGKSFQKSKSQSSLDSLKGATTKEIDDQSDRGSEGSRTPKINKKDRNSIKSTSSKISGHLSESTTSLEAAVQKQPTMSAEGLTKTLRDNNYTGDIPDDQEKLIQLVSRALWLKKQRLHKYNNVLIDKDVEWMQVVTEETLTGLGMAQGASNKLLQKKDEVIQVWGKAVESPEAVTDAKEIQQSNEISVA